MQVGHEGEGAAGKLPVAVVVRETDRKLARLTASQAGTTLPSSIPWTLQPGAAVARWAALKPVKGLARKAPTSG